MKKATPYFSLRQVFKPHLLTGRKVNLMEGMAGHMHFLILSMLITRVLKISPQIG